MLVEKLGLVTAAEARRRDEREYVYLKPEKVLLIGRN